MHPALSVVFFTTASGAGYGLLAWLGILNACGLLPADRLFVSLALAVGLTLVTAGLLSSTFHLGHPERAWRALSQWRSSWLSREGVMALLTYVPALLFAWGCLRGQSTAPLYVGLGVLLAACALLTVFTTAMIYASLRSIDAWRLPQVPALYLLLAAATGLVVFNAIAAVFFVPAQITGMLAAGLLAAVAVLKWAYWRQLDASPARSSAESATGLGYLGTVSVLQQPHGRQNYVMREMGYVIARKHATKLRRIASLLLFVLPVLASLIAATGPRRSVALTAWLALLAVVPGVLAERWLFFAEARHAAMHYYRKS